MQTPSRAGVSAPNESFFLTPSATNICILCHEDITVKFPKDLDGSKKRRLWSNDNEKTKICMELEEFLNVEISYTSDFRSICLLCCNKVKSGLKSQKEKSNLFQKGREIVSAKLLRLRSTSSIDEVEEPAMKKKLLFHKEKERKCAIRTRQKVEDREEVKEVFVDSKAIIKAIEDNEFADFEDEWFQNVIIKKAGEIIIKEVQKLCSSKFNSTFRVRDASDLEQITYSDQHDELQQHAPNLLAVLSNIAIRSDLDERNKMKTATTLIPSIINIVGSILLCRNQSMNANALRNTLILRKGKAEKTCFERFQKLHISLSHNTALKKQLELAKENFYPVLQLKNELEIETKSFVNRIKCTLQDSDVSIPICQETEVRSGVSLYSLDADQSFLEEGALNPNIEIIDIDESILESSSVSSNSDDEYHVSWKPIINAIANSDSNELNDLNHQSSTIEEEADNSTELTFKSKFVFVGDNLDIRTHRRQYLIDKHAVDRHLYNLIVVENRIETPESLIGLKTEKFLDSSKIPMKFLLPTEEDEQMLKENLKILVLRDLVKYVEEIDWMKKFVVNHIPHEYANEASKVSTYYPLGILDHNETTTEGIIEIMKEQHNFVPGHNTENPLRMFSFGDLVTVERQQNAQDDLGDSSTSTDRLEGLIPALADFHTYGNFLEVVWHLLYHASSGSDVGTLFQARNFLNARTVPGSPMKNINACEDLLFKYADALLIAAFKHHVEETSLDISKKSDEQKCKVFIDNMVDNLVEGYITPKADDNLTSSSRYTCPFCKKIYKRVKTLKDHMKTNHKNQEPNVDDDGVQNYSINALAICYLVKNFVDARKHGDGERIIRLYKFLLIYFKVDHRTKYANQSLHLLAQISFLLPPALAFELKWNRFVNTKGRIDSNVELDRHIEHENKYVKSDLAQYQGKLTPTSIERCSRSYSKMKSIIGSIDGELAIEKKSGRHTVIDATSDVLQLASQFSEMDLFRFQPGRYHSRFPGFPKNCVARLDMIETKKWVLKKLKDYQEMNIYKLNNLIANV